MLFSFFSFSYKVLFRRLNLGGEMPAAGLWGEALEFREGLSFQLPKRMDGEPRFGRLDYGLEEYSEE